MSNPAGKLDGNIFDFENMPWVQKPKRYQDQTASASQKIQNGCRNERKEAWRKALIKTARVALPWLVLAGLIVGTIFLTHYAWASKVMVANAAPVEWTPSRHVYWREWTEYLHPRAITGWFCMIVASIAIIPLACWNTVDTLGYC